jgi:hypothetical protein
MAQNVNPTFVKTPNWGATQITTGTGQNVAVTVYTGGTNGSKINAFLGVSIGTTSAFDLLWGVSSGGTLFIYGTSSIPANAGATSAIPTVNLMSNANVPLAIDSDGCPYLFLPSSAYTLQARTNATSSTWTATAVMQLSTPTVGDF